MAWSRRCTVQSLPPHASAQRPPRSGCGTSSPRTQTARASLKKGTGYFSFVPRLSRGFPCGSCETSEKSSLSPFSIPFFHSLLGEFVQLLLYRAGGQSFLGQREGGADGCGLAAGVEDHRGVHHDPLSLASFHLVPENLRDQLSLAVLAGRR